MTDTTTTPDDLAGLPSTSQIARRLAWLLALAVAGVLLITLLPGLESVPEHLRGADAGWIAAALVLEIASTFAFAFAFHGAFGRRTTPRTSTSVSLAMQGMNVVLPAGGSGGLAVGAVILDRAGLPRSFAASRTVALFLTTSLVSFLAIVLAGFGVASGALPGDVALFGALAPAAGALLVVAAVVLLPRVLGGPGAEPTGRLRRALWDARAYLRDGLASSLDLLRAKDRLVIWGAIGYFAFDVAAIAASFQAIGSAVLPIGLLVLAYTLGHAGAQLASAMRGGPCKPSLSGVLGHSRAGARVVPCVLG